MSSEDENSEEGNQNLYHRERERPFEPAMGDSESIELISGHITRWIAEPAFVFHEALSDLVHVDVHVVQPAPGREFYTLVTSGMSDQPMAPPDEHKHEAFAELMLCLPPDWPLDESALDDERNYWPIELLKFLARLPHEYETWFAEFHTVPNNEPMEPYASNVKFCAVTFATPRTAPPEFRHLVVDSDKTVNFLAVVPLYTEEINLALKEGSEPLFKLMEEKGVGELLDVNRANMVKKRLGLS